MGPPFGETTSSGRVGCGNSVPSSLFAAAGLEIVWALKQVILLETGLVAVLEIFGFDCLLGLVAGLETAWVHQCSDIG